MSGFSSCSFLASVLFGWAWIDKALRIARTCQSSLSELLQEGLSSDAVTVWGVP